ncbi:MAG: hypothetical protein HOW73_42760 [Polyangiaceae bacterium]|nr:hypothetical protein [Polyangiaceae bacterium]
MLLRTGLAVVLLAGCSTSNDVTIGSSEPAEPPATAVGSAPKAMFPGAQTATVPAVAADAPAWLGVPRPTEEILSVINKSNRQPYAGKTGILKGRVTIKGDPAPASEEKFPPKGCPEASATYGKAFRVGQDDALADALVTVTGYDAFVPPDKPAEKVKVHGCAFDKRTVALTFGQRLEVLNQDPKASYTPYLDGSEYRAVMVAIPDGDPVKLYPNKPAINYVLRDYQNRPFLKADVLVLKFATHDVTGLDGKYEIGRIPVGKVKVDAYLPSTGKHVEKEIEIKEGDNALDLELTFDAAADKVVATRPDPWVRGTDPTKEAATDGKWPALPKKAPKDVPR